MGAGKTTFISAVCRVLGVSGTIGSPTFSIINEYASARGRIFHMDLYRLKDEEEAMQAGVEDALYSGDYCFVEWPEKAPGLFPPGTVNVTIEAMNESTRKLTLASS
jgi:tRNA threonylcarbamoyladenosine biosynthesis protein TsaE